MVSKLKLLSSFNVFSPVTTLAKSVFVCMCSLEASFKAFIQLIQGLLFLHL